MRTYSHQTQVCTLHTAHCTLHTAHCTLHCTLWLRAWTLLTRAYRPIAGKHRKEASLDADPLFGDLTGLSARRAFCASDLLFCRAASRPDQTTLRDADHPAAASQMTRYGAAGCVESRHLQDAVSYPRFLADHHPMSPSRGANVARDANRPLTWPYSTTRNASVVPGLYDLVSRATTHCSGGWVPTRSLQLLLAPPWTTAVLAAGAFAVAAVETWQPSFAD